MKAPMVAVEVSRGKPSEGCKVWRVNPFRPAWFPRPGGTCGKGKVGPTLFGPPRFPVWAGLWNPERGTPSPGWALSLSERGATFWAFRRGGNLWAKDSGASGTQFNRARDFFPGGLSQQGPGEHRVFLFPLQGYKSRGETPGFWATNPFRGKEKCLRPRPKKGGEKPEEL